MSVKSLIRRCQRELTWYLYPSTHWGNASDRHKWVFVTGCERSGKTMLANLFSNHPRVSVIPNARLHSKALPNSVTERCRHVWTEKIDTFRQTKDSHKCMASRLVFDWLTYHRSPKDIIMVESGLSAAQMPWLQEVFRESYFLGIVRNGYAVAEGLRLKEDYTIERCAQHWNAVNTIMLDDSKLINNFTLIHYEEFVAQPMEVARQVASIIGIDATPLERFVRNGWRLGNEDDGASKLRNVNGEMCGRYEPNAIASVGKHAREMLAHFGYGPL